MITKKSITSDERDLIKAAFNTYKIDPTDYASAIDFLIDRHNSGTQVFGGYEARIAIEAATRGFLSHKRKLAASR